MLLFCTVQQQIQLKSCYHWIETCFFISKLGVKLAELSQKREGKGLQLWVRGQNYVFI